MARTLTSTRPKRPRREQLRLHQLPVLRIQAAHYHAPIFAERLLGRPLSTDEKALAVTVSQMTVDFIDQGSRRILLCGNCDTSLVPKDGGDHCPEHGFATVTFGFRGAPARVAVVFDPFTPELRQRLIDGE